MNTLAGISQSNRLHLVKLHRNTSGLVDAEEAAGLLDLDRVKTAKLLAHWSTQGWVRRLRRGLYLLIPLEATAPEHWSEDPWIIAARLFAPGYIAGWSACEHWGLTEQIFRDIAVFTAAPIRERQTTVDGTRFVLRHIAKRRYFGFTTVWRKGVRVQVSDPSRTLADILDDPRWGGGIRLVSQILDAYLASEHRDDARLLDYIRRLGNAAAAKRLGYLLETSEVSRADPVFLDRLHKLVTSGYALLDPAVKPRGQFVNRWKLRVNVDVT